MRLIGVDGCRAGWVTATLEATGALAFAIARSFADLLAMAGGDALVAIDVPIGLTEREPRACDVAARAFLRAPRSSSVFPAPRRALLPATSYAEACRLSRAACGLAVSRQLFGILLKIREIDALMTPARQERVREAHPEVSFAALARNGAGLPDGKKTTAGEAERLALLGRVLPPFDPGAERLRLGRGNVARDDLVDAVACLATACRISRGAALVLPPGAVPRDARGLRMEIVA